MERLKNKTQLVKKKKKEEKELKKPQTEKVKI